MRLDRSSERLCVSKMERGATSLVSTLRHIFTTIVKEIVSVVMMTLIHLFFKVSTLTLFAWSIKLLWPISM